MTDQKAEELWAEEDEYAELHSDHWSESLLFSYDAGNRGDALTAWFYSED